MFQNTNVFNLKETKTLGLDSDNFEVEWIFKYYVNIVDGALANLLINDVLTVDVNFIM